MSAKLVRRSVSTLLISCGMIVASGTAWAADFAEPAPAISGWSGFYGGIVGSYGAGNSRQDNTGGPTTGDYGISGWMIGALGGHNWQSGSLVYGIEGDISVGNVEGETFNVCVSQCYTEVDWLATLRGRIGYDLGSIMPYVTGGIAIAKLDVGTRQPLVPNQPLGDTDINVGIAAGAGVEYALTGNTNVRLEYLYANLGSTKYHIPPQLAAGTVDGDLHMVRAALTYRFGSPSSTPSEAMGAEGWGGAYAGLIAGYGEATSRQDNSFPATTGDYSVSGYTVGGLAGHNWQNGRTVFGIEGDISFSSLEGQTNTNCGALGCYTELNWFSTIRARVGADLGRFMPYVTAGVAIGEVQAGTRNPIVIGQPLGDKDINAGLAYGVGVDAKLTDSYVLKAEYLRTDLGSTVYFIPSQGQVGDVPVKAVNMFRVGLSRRF